jgi:hypothetical protein
VIKNFERILILTGSGLNMLALELGIIGLILCCREGGDCRERPLLTIAPGEGHGDTLCV